MPNRWFSIFFVSITFFLMTLSGRAQEQAPDPMVLDQERQMKVDAERQAQSICDSILGVGKSSVLVNLELGLQSNRKGGGALSRKLDNKGGGLGEENYILPWVPAPKSVTQEEVPKDANVETQAAQQTVVDVKTVMRRFDITVVHDDQIAEGRIELARETLKSAFRRYENILQILFRPTSFVTEKGINPAEKVKENFLESLNLKTLLFLFLLLLAIWVMKFLFGPLAKFMSDYIDGMKELSKSRVEMENKSQNENDTDAQEEGVEGQEGELSPEELAELEAQEALMQEEKFEPFNYVTDENVKQLAYLLHHEEPWIVALVISYLSSEHAYKVMEMLPADLQAKVALETAMYRQTSLDQVHAINEDIREKIDFVVGGLEKLVNILESSDRFARDNILEYLKNEKPGLYEKVRERILLFEDLVKFPKLAMQTLVRELKTEDLGKALRNVSPELQQKFYDNMSQGAVTLLKEEIEFGRPVTPDQIEEERRKILEMIKMMEADGKISFREKGADSALSGDEIGSEPQPLDLTGSQPTQEEAEAAYAAGAQALEEGQFDEARRQFQTCVAFSAEWPEALQGMATALYSAGEAAEAVEYYERLLAIQPNDELRDWVEQVKATLTPAA